LYDCQGQEADVGGDLVREKKGKKGQGISQKGKTGRRAVQELAGLFRDPDKPPVFLLRAGASYRAGVPMAGDAVWWVVEKHFSRYVRGGQLQTPRRSELEVCRSPSPSRRS
jgi:hypothetical protein